LQFLVLHTYEELLSWKCTVLYMCCMSYSRLSLWTAKIRS